MKIIYTLRLFVLTVILLSAGKAIAADYYWVGGSGNWSDYANHWATQPGGNIFHTQVPQTTDNVFFDAKSFTSFGLSVTIDQTIVHCRDMTWTGVTNMPSLAGVNTNRLNISGSLTLSPVMNLAFNGQTYFEATTTGHTVTSAGRVFKSQVNFEGIGGEWTLKDNFTTPALNLTSGTLNANNLTIDAGVFSICCTATLNIVSSTIYVKSQWNFNSTGGAVINAVPSTIIVTSSSATFWAGGATYYDVNFTAKPTSGMAPTIRDNNNKFHDVRFEDEGNINSTGNTFNDVFFGGNAFNIFGNNFFNSLFLSKNGSIAGSNSYNRLTLNAGYTYQFSGTQTITDSLIANGNCGAPISISSTTQATFSKSSGTVTVSYINMKNTGATGGATFIANNTVDLGNNTGWTINNPASKNLYWVGGTGNWSDGTHWSLTSGGAAFGCAPFPVDNVFFDAGSFPSGGVVTIDQLIASCNNMNWTGVTNMPSLAGVNTNRLNIYGSLTLSPVMNLAFNGSIYFLATAPGKTVTSAGRVFKRQVNFEGIGGEWTLKDNFTTPALNLTSGTLNANNLTIDAGDVFSICCTATLNIVSSTIYVKSQWNFNSTGGAVINAVPSTIIVTSSSATFWAGGATYYDVNFTAKPTSGMAPTIRDNNNKFHDVRFEDEGNINSTGNTFNDVFFGGNAFNIFGNNFFNSLFLSKNGSIAGSNSYNRLTLNAGYTYQFSGTQTITDSLIANGNCGAPISISSTTQATFSKSSGTVTVSYINMKNTGATGGATFIANNTVDLGNNTGWTINNPASKNLYWVGGTGNWSDGTHWSLTSGGAAFGCAPFPVDNVFFDAGSFPSGGVVTIDQLIASCNNMNWTGVTNMPSLAGVNTNRLNIYGSLTLSPVMNLAFNGSIYFLATAPGKTVTSAGRVFKRQVNFEGIGGEWTLKDNFTTPALNLTSGTLNANNLTIDAGDVFSICCTATLNIVSSTIYVKSQWNFNSTGGAVINAVPSTIIVTSSSATFWAGGATYYDVNFTAKPTSGMAPTIRDNNNKFHDVRFEDEGNINSTGNTFNDVFFGGKAFNISGNNFFNSLFLSKNGSIAGSNTYNSLTLSAGYTYTFSSGSTQTFISGLNANGNGSFPIRIQSGQAGLPATFYKQSGTVCLVYVRLSDNTATGGAIFDIANGEDISGNTGWTFLNSGSAPSVNISASPSGTVCGGTTVQFTATQTNGGVTPSYRWMINGVNAGTNDSIFSSATLNNGDEVTCQMIQGISCFSDSAISNAITVTIGNNVQAGIITALRDTICDGTPGSLTVTGSTSAIQWQSSVLSNNFTVVSGATDAAYFPQPSQTSYYRVIAGSGNCADTSALFRLIVLASPVADFTNVASGLKVNFGDASIGATIYSWDFGDNATSTETNPVHSYNNKNIYHVCLTVYNGSNCSFTTCKDIDLLTGVTTLSGENGFLVYPNPFTNSIFISNKSSMQIESIELIDVLGRILRTQDAGHKTQDEINVSDLAKGVYILKIKTSEDIFIHSLIKQ